MGAAGGQADGKQNNNQQGGKAATDAINAWYSAYKK